MIKLWNEATQEDIMTEVIPGVMGVDEQAVARLDWTSYLAHMQDLIREGLGQDEKFVRGHFDDLTFLIYGERIRVERGTYPVAQEVMAFRELPSTKTLIDQLTSTTMQFAGSTWAAWENYKRLICARFGINQAEFDKAFND